MPVSEQTGRPFVELKLRDYHSYVLGGEDKVAEVHRRTTLLPEVFKAEVKTMTERYSSMRMLRHGRMWCSREVRSGALSLSPVICMLHALFIEIHTT